MNIGDSQANALLARGDAQQQANIFRGNTQRPFAIQSMTLPLDTAAGVGNPYKIGFPFRSIFVRTATDSITTVSLQPDSIDSFQSAVPLTINDSMDFETVVSSAFLTWTAQAGKTITLVFFVDAAFRSGSQLSVSSGGVSISEGTAVTTTLKTFVAATQLSVFASSTLRKVGTFQNNTGNSVWMGPTGVTNSGSSIGIEVPAGGTFIWKNTAQLFGYSVLGGTGVIMEET